VFSISEHPANAVSRDKQEPLKNLITGKVRAQKQGAKCCNSSEIPLLNIVHAPNYCMDTILFRRLETGIVIEQSIF